MANDTLPMNEFFLTCRKVLDEELRMLHYTDLTEKALRKHGLSKTDVNWERQIEDVREKMLKAGLHETFYIGKPFSLAGVTWWVKDELRLLRPTSGITIPGNATRGADGAFDALMRTPSFKTKTHAPTDRRFKGRANGLVTEMHVSDWFEVTFPEFYQLPDNLGKWSKGCDHDFKLLVNGRLIKVDVSGQKLNGEYGNPGQGKKRVDFHLLCRLYGKDVLWEGMVKGRDYEGTIFVEKAIYPEKLIVWLNSVRDNIDYDAIKEYLQN